MTGIAASQLRTIVERIERLKEEQDSIRDDIKDVYAEAKSNGFDKTALGIVVANRRKRAKNPDKADELASLVDLYESALGTPSHAHTREAAE